MKKTITITLIIALISCIFLSIPASAITTDNTERTIEYLDNGDYIETIITDNTASSGISLYATNTITKTKTKYYKNSSGTVLWSVAIKATFSYNGSTSTCTGCSHITTAPASAWSIKSASHSKSGNTATAKATATYKTSAGSTDYSMSVTIKCSATGVVS
ncbi:hypothetical protein [uncultured Ruminococcus sp.]|uniref:hypothetical protein n=1 Tax=uncultured Ruminococcus sp. TaxID=165186 RepID=UPI0025E765A5|nr:hypothetical protein [uncultured Ruminococcus sp.]